VESALGPIRSRFATFDDEPLAVTALAQVHGATLADGSAVVVKVIRPNWSAARTSRRSPCP